MRPGLIILGVSHSCGSQTDECATPARLDPRRRHGFLTLRLGYHVGHCRRAKNTPEHLITQVVPKYLTQVVPKYLTQVRINRRRYERQGEQPPLPWRHAAKAILFQVARRRPKRIGVTHYTYSGAGRPHKLHIPAAASAGNEVPVVSYRIAARPPPEPVCKQTWTHSRFCSLTLTETLPFLDERRF